MEPPEDDGYEAFEGPGFVMERMGRFIRTRSTLNAEEHAEMRRVLGDGADEAHADMVKRVEELYVTLHQYEPEAMIGSVAFRNHLIGSEHGGFSATGDKNHAFVEYVTTLYVRDPGEGTEIVVPPGVLADVQERVQSLFSGSPMLWIARDAKRGDDARDDNLELLRYLTFMDSLAVRYPGYHQHLVDVLDGLHAAMSRDLADHLGWNIDDAKRIAIAAVVLLEDRLNDTFACGRQAMSEHDVASLEGEEKQRWLYGLSAWIQFRMSFSLGFTPDELAKASGVPMERVRAFLDAACLAWRSCQEEYYLLPHATPRLQRKPVLALGKDRYLLPLPTSLIWAVRHVVEDCLKADTSDEGKKWWERYEKARSQFVEARAVSLLAGMLPRAGAFRSLTYTPMEDGQPTEGELDGLIIADDIAILMEVKAGGMSEPGRRGAPSGMKEDLESLVGEAHDQALRARDYLKSSDEVTFTLSDGTALAVKSGDIDDIIMVTVTLESLDIFTATLYRLAELGVLREDELPWAVSLLDLAAIAEAVEFPAQLIHFLRRRRRVNELTSVMAHDELDWFGHYLSEGLYFENLVAEDDEHMTFVSFVGYSKDLDAHFVLADCEDADVPPLPRQSMPDEMRALLLELEDSQPHGYLHISLALLDLSTEARLQFFEGVEQTVERTLGDGERHDFTMILDAAHGGLHFSSSTDRTELQRHLRAYGQLKMYQVRCSEWVGTGRLVPSSHLLDEAIYMRKPWEFDDELERLVAEYLQPLPSRDGSAGDDEGSDSVPGSGRHRGGG